MAVGVIFSYFADNCTLESISTLQFSLFVLVFQISGRSTIVQKGKNIVNCSDKYIKVPIAPNYKGVCLQSTSEFHSYHLKI